MTLKLPQKAENITDPSFEVEVIGINDYWSEGKSKDENSNNQLKEIANKLSLIQSQVFNSIQNIKKFNKFFRIDQFIDSNYFKC